MLLRRRVGFGRALAVSLTAADSAAGTVVPSDRVSVGVNVRARPDAESEIVGLLQPGVQVQHLGSVPRWNEVQLSGGQIGFVSSARTVVIRDSDGPPVSEGEGTSPEITSPPTGSARDGSFDFWHSEALAQKLASQNSILFSTQLALTARSSLHSLGSDCELHIGGTPVDASDFVALPAFVVEPPDLCKKDPPGGGSWTALITNQLLGRTCTVTAFPRVYDVNLVGDETLTNPHHMLEIHPALKIDCPGGGSLDAAGFVAYHDGMSEIQASSAARCFDTRPWVRRNTAEKRYELRAQRSRNCGKVASFEYPVFDEWIRELPNAGHSALIRVRPEGLTNKTLKLYTYPGTTVDDTIAAFDSSAEARQGVVVHRMLTFDYFAIIKTVRALEGTFLPVAEWTEIPFPIALVAFAPKVDPDPEEHD